MSVLWPLMSAGQPPGGAAEDQELPVDQLAGGKAVADVGPVGDVAQADWSALSWEATRITGMALRVKMVSVAPARA